MSTAALTFVCALIALTAPSAASADPALPTMSVPGLSTVVSGEQFTVEGTGESGAEIRLFDNSAPAGTTTVLGNGTWTAQITAVDGDNSVRADEYIGSDLVANSDDVHVFGVGAPSVNSPAGGDRVSPTFELLGDAVPGAAITVTDDDGNVIGNATADTCGCWDVTTDVELGYGTQTIHVTQTTDLVTSDDTPITVDVIPDPPVLTAPAEGATVNPGDVHFTGTGVAGATIEIETDTGDPITTGTVGLDGNFDIAGTITDLGYQYVVARQTASGVASDGSDVRVFLVDEQHPTLQLDNIGPVLTGDTVHEVRRGKTSVVTITVQNTGGTVAAKVKVCTKPATKATFVKRSPGATVKKKPASVCWTIASLAPGAKVTKTLTVKIAPSAPLKPITLSATAAIGTAKPVTAKVKLTVKR